MRFTRERLSAAAEAAARWSAAARRAGRAEDADTLDTLGAAAAHAAGRFATRDPLVPEDPDGSERVRRNGLFAGCVPAAGKDAGAEACPWSKEGVCKGCAWKDTQWIISGRRYECLTAHVCRGRRE